MKNEKMTLPQNAAIFSTAIPEQAPLLPRAAPHDVFQYAGAARRHRSRFCTLSRCVGVLLLPVALYLLVVLAFFLHSIVLTSFIENDGKTSGISAQTLLQHRNALAADPTLHEIERRSFVWNKPTDFKISVRGKLETLLKIRHADPETDHLHLNSSSVAFAYTFKADNPNVPPLKVDVRQTDGVILVSITGELPDENNNLPFVRNPSMFDPDRRILFADLILPLDFDNSASAALSIGADINVGNIVAGPFVDTLVFGHLSLVLDAGNVVTQAVAADKLSVSVAAGDVVIQASPATDMSVKTSAGNVDLDVLFLKSLVDVVELSEHAVPHPRRLDADMQVDDSNKQRFAIVPNGAEPFHVQNGVLVLGDSLHQALVQVAAGNVRGKINGATLMDVAVASGNIDLDLAMAPVDPGSDELRSKRLIQLNTDFGKIKGNFVSYSDLRADVSMGPITAVVSPLAGSKSVLATSSGNVDLFVSAEYNGSYVAKTTFGSVDVVDHFKKNSFKNSFKDDHSLNANSLLGGKIKGHHGSNDAVQSSIVAKSEFGSVILKFSQ